jgi:hypothetical protein
MYLKFKFCFCSLILTSSPTGFRKRPWYKDKDIVHTQRADTFITNFVQKYVTSHKMYDVFPQCQKCILSAQAIYSEDVWLVRWRHGTVFPLCAGGRRFSVLAAQPPNIFIVLS